MESPAYQPNLLALYLDDKSPSYKHTLFSQRFAFWGIFFSICDAIQWLHKQSSALKLIFWSR